MRKLSFIYTFIFALIISVASQGAQLKLRSFELDPTDLSASQKQRVDANNIPCALVIVHLPVAGCEFQGNLVGKPEYHANEYWVYLSAGTKKLKIMCPGAESVMFDIANDLGEGLLSKRTYNLYIDGYENLIVPTGVYTGPAKSYAILNINPKVNAIVNIDGKMRNVSSGTFSELLDFGSYPFTVMAEGYAPYSGTLVVNSEDNATLNVNLVSVMAKVTLRTETSGATISLNNVDKGVSKFEGELLPGSYMVEAKKQGYRPYKSNLNIEEGQKVDLTLPALQPIYGAINIGFEPIGAKITIDGVDRGTSPRIVREVLEGRHKVTISMPGYSDYSTEVNVGDGNMVDLKGSLDQSRTTTSSGKHEMVDLGLSVKWATCNIGANSPEKYGDFFAWGETAPKEEYKESNSKTFKKDWKTDISGTQHDAATVNWGEGWRMPTKDEMKELLDFCKWEKTQINGVKGWKLISKRNGNSIFLPAAGYDGVFSSKDNSEGQYWTSTPHRDDNNTSYDLSFSLNDYRHVRTGDYRCTGRPIRPVHD